MWTSTNKQTQAVHPFFNTAHTDYITVYVFLVNNTNVSATDIALALGYKPYNATFSVSNTLFIDFIGFAIGIVVIITGIYKLGLRF